MSSPCKLREHTLDVYQWMLFILQLYNRHLFHAVDCVENFMAASRMGIVKALFCVVVGSFRLHLGSATFVGSLDVVNRHTSIVINHPNSHCGHRRHRRQVSQSEDDEEGLLGPFLPISSRFESRKVGNSGEEEENYDSLAYRYYEHAGWKLAYRYKPASPGYESLPPLVCVHPVGIGLSGWFWDKLVEQPSPAIYVPDLIGCGASERWEPDVKGLAFPLGWAQGVETLVNEIVLEKRQKLFASPRSCVVVVQGGLAPVGVLLAARNPQSVSHLVLTSPPTWRDMTTPIPTAELDRNMNFLTNPVIGPIAFGILESRCAIEFFSNAFLFEHKCDALWLEQCTKDLSKGVRPPVTAFNAGLCNHRAFEEELTALPQPALVLSGMADKRYKDRRDYFGNMKACTLQLLPGQNVLPWESPKEVIDAILAHME
uniref:AB hydrolase-1 domain-containing protein n=1 Tax=Grammatophora oceanica TaxID=210454 RepID=A0A7S1V0P4_9STRA|mmetsp:Transcript_32799/g.48587  ORF Transcript_32799/g.48587 Transcript_32799/m.48587 type:complete len:428 (+) Transcript_32799:1-1284(+)